MSNRIPIALALVATLGLAGCQMFMEEEEPAPLAHTTRPVVHVNGTDPELERVRYPRMEQGWYPFAARAPLGPEEFLRRAITGNMLEIELGRMAEQRATDPRVRAFAERMAHDHELANQRLQEVAGSHSVRVPERINLQQQDILDSVAATRDGAAFDVRYMRLMVQEHEQMLDLFERQSRDESMPLLQVTVAGLAPMIHEHLRHAQHLLEELEAAAPAAEPAPSPMRDDSQVGRQIIGEQARR